MAKRRRKMMMTRARRRRGVRLAPNVAFRPAVADPEGVDIAGARAAHLDRKIGSLTPGKEADLLCWRPTASTFSH